MITRNMIEHIGRQGAGIKEENENLRLVRCLDMFDLWCDPADSSLTPNLERDGYWEAWISAWLINQLSPGVTFYDIGANCGYYSMMALTRGARVSAFEPNPLYAYMLGRSAEANGAQSQFKIYNHAISDKTGEATLYVPGAMHGSASLMSFEEFYEQTAIAVKTFSMDDLFPVRSPGTPIVKIDVEGHEEHVWNGMRGFLCQPGPSPIVMLEYTPGAYSEHFYERLEEYGNVTQINFDGGESPVSKDGLESKGDWTMLVVREG